jgi:hypothetical protein
MRRPVAYVVKQRGLSEYTEIVQTKRQAMEAARDMLWWSKQVIIRPLYAGKEIRVK